MKNRLYFSIMFVILLTSLNSKSKDYQLFMAEGPAIGTPDYFSQSIFSSGINLFFKDIFNNPRYIQDFLPNNFFHMMELLLHGNKTGKDARYVKSVLRVFGDKMKASSYVNAYAFGDLLDQLPTLLAPHFTIDTAHALDSLKDVIYEIQYQTFSKHFPEFKADHETFLKNLSVQIEDAVELRKLMMVFLEICLNKLVWNPQDQFATWEHTKQVSNQLALLYKSGIVCDVEDINSLFITLLERYCLFLDISSPTITIETFAKIKEDIHATHIPFLRLDEQESFLETKVQRIMRCLIDLEAKARARESGFVIKN